MQLNNYIAFDDRAVLNIIGPPGSGKTSLLRTWGRLFEINRNRGVFFFMHFDLAQENCEREEESTQLATAISASLL